MKKTKISKPRYRQKPELDGNSMGGNIAEGAVSGASSGAMLGPWGAAAGAVIGGGMGYIKGKAELDAENNRIANSAQANELAVNNAYLANQVGSFNNANLNQYAEGGQLNEFNGGGTHEENPIGGIPMGNGNSVEEGETEFTPENYVFSDRLTLNKDLANEFGYSTKDSKKTFADISKSINDKYSKRTGDSIEEESKTRELSRLMEAQEAIKAEKQQKDLAKFAKEQPELFAQMMQSQNATSNEQMPQEMPQGPQMGQMAMGGYRNTNSNAYDLGGDLQRLNTNLANGVITPEQYKLYKTQINSGVSLDSILQGTPNVPREIEDMYNPGPSNIGQTDSVLDNQFNTDSTRTGNLDPSQISDGIDDLYGDSSNSDPAGFKPSTMSQIGKFAPIAYNMYQGLKKEDKLDANDYTTKERIDPATLNIDPMLRSNIEGRVNIQNQIASGAAGSGSTYLANIGQAQLRKQKADTDAYVRKDNYDDAQRVSADQFNIGIDQRNKGITQSVDDWNMRSKANKESHLSDAAYNIAGISEADTQTKANAYGYSKAAPMYSYMFDNYLSKNKK